MATMEHCAEIESSTLIDCCDSGEHCGEHHGGNGEANDDLEDENDNDRADGPDRSD